MQHYRTFQILKATMLPVRIGGALVILAFMVLLWSTLPVIGSLFAGRLPETGSIQIPDMSALDDQYAVNLQESRDQFESRSPFYMPARQSEKQPEQIVEDKPLGGPYNGPKLVGLVGERAYFDQRLSNNKQYLDVGERAGALYLARIRRPWFADVRWNNREYAIALFDDANGPRYSAPMGDSSGRSSEIFGNRPSNSAGDPRSQEVPFGRRGRRGDLFNTEEDIGIPRGNDLFISPDDH